MDIKQIVKDYLAGTKIQALEGFQIAGRVEKDSAGSRLIIETHIKSSLDFPGDSLENVLGAVLQMGNFRTPSAP